MNINFKKNRMTYSALLLGLFTLSTSGVRAQQADLANEILVKRDIPTVSMNTIQFGISLSKSRLIYPANSSGVTLNVSNQQDYPVLVQSRVINEGLKTEVPFAVVPPLFRLDSGMHSALRVVRTGGISFPDREDLHWLCVKGIPPSEGDLWAKDGDDKQQTKKVSLNLLVSMDDCIKLITRPESLQGSSADSAGKLTWKISNNHLVVTNPTPFYMSLSSVVFGGKSVPAHYVAPQSSWSLQLPKGASSRGKVSWKVINDYGGESQEWSAVIR